MRAPRVRCGLCGSRGSNRFKVEVVVLGRLYWFCRYCARAVSKAWDASPWIGADIVPSPDLGTGRNGNEV